jgi:hypothetical protein
VQRLYEGAEQATSEQVWLATVESCFEVEVAGEAQVIVLEEVDLRRSADFPNVSTRWGRCCRWVGC